MAERRRKQPRIRAARLFLDRQYDQMVEGSDAITKVDEGQMKVLERLEVEGKTAHWGPGSEYESHLRSLVHVSTMVDEH